MGSLQNTLRTPVDEGLPAVGLISIGDSICHTDPVFALGLSLGLIQARALVEALEGHGSDLAAAALGFYGSIFELIEERFHNATAVDALRLRAWSGEAIDLAHRDGGAYPYFAFAAGGAAALLDDEVFRTVVRRNYLLDPLSVLDDDVALQGRIERVFAEVRATPRPAPGPSRQELLAAMRKALGN